MAPKKKDAPERGKISASQIRDMMNKKAGCTVSHDLTKENPTDVKEWIPTGSHVLDCIISQGAKTGIPSGKIVELAGLSSSGKSYIAAQICANAQKMGYSIVYFDSESAIDSDFLSRAGCDVEDLIYCQALNIEFVLETVEDLMKTTDNKFLFVLDSFAFTPCKTDLEGDFNPQSTMAMKPRIMSKGLQKLIQPIANSNSIFLVVNQLKANIVTGPTAHVEMMINPWIVPGGNTLPYAYSLRIWLTGRKSKASYVTSENGFRIGNETNCLIKKSRFGTEGRQCSIKLIWGSGDVHVKDEDAWLDIIKESEYVESGVKWKMIMEDGSEYKFASAEFEKELENKKFKDRVIWIVENELITKFAAHEGNAAKFYSEDPVIEKDDED